MLRSLFVRLWKDESGAVIATEYLMLGSIVAIGSAGGMAAMRDSVVDEYKEFGQGVRETRQSYAAPAHRGGAAKTGGSAVTDTATTGVVPSSQNLTFTCPVP
jgi:Flp pilus assembly pilin Flp